MLNFKPKDRIFFDLFTNGVQISNSCAIELKVLLENLKSPEASLEKVTNFEKEGDKVTHQLIEYTKKMFITPLDREDIFNITKCIDTVTDNIEAAAHRFYMYAVEEPSEEAVKVVNLLVKATEELIVVIQELKSLNHSELMLEKIISINTIENEADQVYRQAIRNLFINENDVMHVMKWKDLYKYLEEAVDACEKLANEIRGVVMKYA